MVCNNKQPGAAFADTVPLTPKTGQPISGRDTDTGPLTSEKGQPISERDTYTGPLTSEIGQPISERDTGTTTRLIDTHVLERRCGSDGPTRRLRSESVNIAKETRQLTLIDLSVSTSISRGTSG